jgi:biopolymer transport protein ExbD
MGDSQAMAAKLSGGGGDRYSLGQNSEINVTPFVDILLVLLIIFMVAVPMAVTSIKIDLPPASPPPSGRQAEGAGVHLDPEVGRAVCR